MRGGGLRRPLAQLLGRRNLQRRLWSWRWLLGRRRYRRLRRLRRCATKPAAVHAFRVYAHVQVRAFPERRKRRCGAVRRGLVKKSVLGLFIVHVNSACHVLVVTHAHTRAQTHAQTHTHTHARAQTHTHKKDPRPFFFVLSLKVKSCKHLKNAIAKESENRSRVDANNFHNVTHHLLGGGHA